MLEETKKKVSTVVVVVFSRLEVYSRPPGYRHGESGAAAASRAALVLEREWNELVDLETRERDAMCWTRLREQGRHEMFQWSRPGSGVLSLAEMGPEAGGAG